MKKLSFLALLAMICFSFCACDDKEEEETVPADPVVGGCDIMFYLDVLDEFDWGNIWKRYTFQQIDEIQKVTTPVCKDYYNNLPQCKTEAMTMINCLGKLTEPVFREKVTLYQHCVKHCADDPDDETSECYKGLNAKYNACMEEVGDYCRKEIDKYHECLDKNEYYVDLCKYDNDKNRKYMVDVFYDYMEKYNANYIKNNPIEPKLKETIESRCKETWEKYVNDLVNEFKKQKITVSDEVQAELKKVSTEACVKYVSEMPACNKHYLNYMACYYEKDSSAGCEEKQTTFESCMNKKPLEVDTYIELSHDKNPAHVLEDVLCKNKIKESLYCPSPEYEVECE